MMRSFRTLMVVGLMALLFVALHASAPRAYAASYVVTTTDDNTTDDASCTLREAIDAANNAAVNNNCGAASSADDTITFNVSGTITLGSTLPNILASVGKLTIDGTGQSVTISGDNSYRVLSVNSGANLTVANVTIANGASAGGGGISNAGTLTVTNSTFSGNHAVDGGGGIYNVLGTLMVTNSTFSGNHAVDGGGIGNIFGKLTVTNSTLSGNSATNDGGGIYDYYTTVTVTNSTFSGNTGGVGGGIANHSGTVTIMNSTFSGSSATNDGGGIANGGTHGNVTVTNSTFSGNSATNDGGGIANVNASSTATLRNTIVANSPSGGNCIGSITDDGGNLQFGGTVADSCGATIPTSDPVLGALANNGGPTQTMALGAGSAALDQIPNAGGCGFGVTTDQRGIARPQPPSGLCDIGAYELEQQAPAPVSSKPAEVPEADTLLLLGGGMGGMVTWVRWQWRKRKG